MVLECQVMESGRPAWGKRFHEQTLRHAFNLRIERLKSGWYEVKMIGGGFVAGNLSTLMDRLIEKKHLDPLLVGQLGWNLACDDEERREEVRVWMLSHLQNVDLDLSSLPELCLVQRG